MQEPQDTPRERRLGVNAAFAIGGLIVIIASVVGLMAWQPWDDDPGDDQDITDININDSGPGGDEPGDEDPGADSEDSEDGGGDATTEETGTSAGD